MSGGETPGGDLLSPDIRPRAAANFKGQNPMTRHITAANSEVMSGVSGIWKGARMSNPTPRLSHKERAERRERIAQEVRDGATAGETTIKHGVQMTTVVNACRSYGVNIPRRPPTGEIPVASRTFEIVAALQNTNRSQRGIAADFGVSPARVGQIYKATIDAGIKFPNRPDYGKGQDE
jgi:hypothetical protein